MPSTAIPAHHEMYAEIPAELSTAMGPVTVADLVDPLARQYGLTEEQVAGMYDSDNGPVFADRIRRLLSCLNLRTCGRRLRSRSSPTNVIRLSLLLQREGVGLIEGTFGQIVEHTPSETKPAAPDYSRAAANPSRNPRTRAKSPSRIRNGATSRARASKSTSATCASIRARTAAASERPSLASR